MQASRSNLLWLAIGAAVLLMGQQGLPWMADKATKDPVKAKITGSQRVEPATVVKLFGDQSTGNPTLFRWRAKCAKFELVDDGKNILTSLDHGVTAEFELMVTDGKTVDHFVYLVSANDASPTPPGPSPDPGPSPSPGPTPSPHPAPQPIPPKPTPTPVDPPQPAPVVDEAIADEIHKLALQVVSDTRPAEAKQLAAGAKKVAAGIADGTLKTFDDVAYAMVGEMRRMPSAWKPFLAACSERIKSLYRDGTMKTMDGCRVVLLSTAEGLERAAKETRAK